MTLLGRTPKKVEGLASDLRAGAPAEVGVGDLQADLPKALAEHDILVQGTPIGMYPESIGETCVPAHLLEPRHVVFDMVYRPLKTRLIQDAEGLGCITILGYEMLLQQAGLQFERWTGLPAPIGVMREALLGALQEREPRDSV